MTISKMDNSPISLFPIMRNAKIKIKYSDFEDLLKQNEIWNNGNDFNYEYRESQKEFSKSIRLNIENEEKILFGP